MLQKITLDQLSSHQKARVKRVNGSGAVRRRLMEMGLVPGVEIEMLKPAPLGNPIEYRVRGYHLALRKSEAAFIELEV